MTGKGPLKQRYEEIFAQREEKSWRRTQVQTLWLEADDYPRMVGAADLGICLHYSSSGYDLPMKVIDMFGAGLPCAAISYRTIGELVEHQENGFVFKDSNELAGILLGVAEDFATGGVQMRNMRDLSLIHI